MSEPSCRSAIVSGRVSASHPDQIESELDSNVMLEDVRLLSELELKLSIYLGLAASDGLVFSTIAQRCW